MIKIEKTLCSWRTAQSLQSWIQVIFLQSLHNIPESRLSSWVIFNNQHQILQASREHGLGTTTSVGQGPPPLRDRALLAAWRKSARTGSPDRGWPVTLSYLCLPFPSSCTCSCTSCGTANYNHSSTSLRNTRTHWTLPTCLAAPSHHPSQQQQENATGSFPNTSWPGTNADKGHTRQPVVSNLFTGCSFFFFFSFSGFLLPLHYQQRWLLPSLGISNNDKTKIIYSAKHLFWKKQMLCLRENLEIWHETAILMRHKWHTSKTTIIHGHLKWL